MASKALRVIRGGIIVERLVRVVTGYASEARIAFGPATALFQPIRLKAHSLYALCPGLTDVVRGTVTGSAKIHLCHGSQAPWVENGLATLGIPFLVHELGMFGAGTMTSFTIHTKDKARRIKSCPSCGSRGVTAKATAHGDWIKPLAERLIEGWRRHGRVARGQVQVLQATEEAHAALVERAIPLQNISLAPVS